MYATYHWRFPGLQRRRRSQATARRALVSMCMAKRDLYPRVLLGPGGIPLRFRSVHQLPPHLRVQGVHFEWWWGSVKSSAKMEQQLNKKGVALIAQSHEKEDKQQEAARAVENNGLVRGLVKRTRHLVLPQSQRPRPDPQRQRRRRRPRTPPTLQRRERTHTATRAGRGTLHPARYTWLGNGGLGVSSHL